MFVTGYSVWSGSGSKAGAPPPLEVVFPPTFHWAPPGATPPAPPLRCPGRPLPPPPHLPAASHPSSFRSTSWGTIPEFQYQHMHYIGCSSIGCRVRQPEVGRAGRQGGRLPGRHREMLNTVVREWSRQASSSTESRLWSIRLVFCVLWNIWKYM